MLPPFPLCFPIKVIGRDEPFVRAFTFRFTLFDPFKVSFTFNFLSIGRSGFPSVISANMTFVINSIVFTFVVRITLLTVVDLRKSQGEPLKLADPLEEEVPFPPFPFLGFLGSEVLRLKSISNASGSICALHCKQKRHPNGSRNLHVGFSVKSSHL